MINYMVLATAMSFYQSTYKIVDLDWRTDLNAAYFTCRELSKILITNENDCLLGSAEQGFIAQCLNDTMPFDEKLAACTPCFRLEEPDTPWHRAQFMKVELGVRVRDVADADTRMQELMQDARIFMGTWGARPETLPTPDGADFIVAGVEVGSYGFRQLPTGDYWVYGTGVAEPRFSMALKAI